MEIATGSVFVRYECSVVGRGGSRTALTGAVIMEQAGSTVGAGSKPARCDNDYILLILGGFGTHPYEVGYLGSPFSNNETPEDESSGACFCLLLLFTEIEQKNFISLL